MSNRQTILSRTATRVLPTQVGCLMALLSLSIFRPNLSAAADSRVSSTTPACAKAPAEMVLIPSGVYRPVLRAANDPREVPIESFYLDRLPVTTGEFLEFVRANPRWRRSQVRSLFADPSYLKNWESDLDPGTNAALNTPVTFVSWFAAKAFAQSRGKRLPTVAEWEYAARASATRVDGENDPAFRQQILRWYSSLSSCAGPVGLGQANVFGAQDLHGLVWEWVLDFNSTMLTGDSRGDAGGIEKAFFCGTGAQTARDANDYPAFMRMGFRSSLSADYCVHNLGFRCAKDL